MENGYGYILIDDSQDENFGIFGDVFMRNFYVVFDNGNLKFGFAPLINAPETKPALVAGTTPKCSYTTYGTTLCDASSGSSTSSFGKISSIDIIITVIVVLVVIGVFAYFMIEFYLNKPTPLPPATEPSSSSTSTTGPNEIESQLT